MIIKKKKKFFYNECNNKYRLSNISFLSKQLKKIEIDISEEEKISNDWFCSILQEYSSFEIIIFSFLMHFLYKYSLFYILLFYFLSDLSVVLLILMKFNIPEK